MSDDFFSNPNAETVEDLNREIDELYGEIEDLHDETDMLLGLMSGSFAFFLKHLITAHQSDAAIAPETCQKIVIAALQRVLATQKRFDCDLITELQMTYTKMDRAETFHAYLSQAQTISRVHDEKIHIEGD